MIRVKYLATENVFQIALGVLPGSNGHIHLYFQTAGNKLSAASKGKAAPPVYLILIVPYIHFTITLQLKHNL
jgi:hypothetical protein